MLPDPPACPDPQGLRGHSRRGHETPARRIRCLAVPDGLSGRDLQPAPSAGRRGRGLSLPPAASQGERQALLRDRVGSHPAVRRHCLAAHRAARGADRGRFLEPAAARLGPRQPGHVRATGHQGEEGDALAARRDGRTPRRRRAGPGGDPDSSSAGKGLGPVGHARRRAVAHVSGHLQPRLHRAASSLSRSGSGRMGVEPGRGKHHRLRQAHAPGGLCHRDRRRATRPRARRGRAQGLRRTEQPRPGGRARPPDGCRAVAHPAAARRSPHGPRRHSGPAPPQ